MSENDKDIANVEAWAELLEDLLTLAPPDKRADVLTLAVKKEQAERKDRESNGPFKCMAWDGINWDAPGQRHWNAIERLKSLVVQVFVRDITNNNSAKNAGKILFAQHQHGRGSRCLGDYIDDLPRNASSASSSP
jgi:hypothetical protein